MMTERELVTRLLIALFRETAAVLKVVASSNARLEKQGARFNGTWDLQRTKIIEPCSSLCFSNSFHCGFASRRTSASPK